MTLQSLKIRWQMFWSQMSANPALRLRILTGLKNTMIIAAMGFIIGVILGSLLAVIKLLPQKKKGVRVLSKICDIYVAIFRGTPIVVQLLVSYYLILPLLGVKTSGMSVCILMFGLNSGAYVSEIMRGGILSVDVGQLEAGRTLGLSFTATMLKVVFPQAIKNVVPTLGNELIALVKETSVVSFVGAADLFTAFQYIGAIKYDYVIPYLMMALIYIVIVVILTLLLKLLEKKLRKGDKR